MTLTGGVFLVAFALQLGAFFSKRMSLAKALGIPLSLVAAFYLDYWKKVFPAFELYGYSIHRLVLVEEVGEVKERVIIQELFSEIGRTTRNLSTIWGFRYVIRLPLSFTKKKMKK